MISKRQSWEVYCISAVVSFSIALGFYFDSRQDTVNNLSSDQWNIITVCIKLDHPELFEGDMVADNVSDIKYYTPFFVNTTRFLTRFSDDNYIEGLNKLNVLINFFYSFFWTLLFWHAGCNFPVALFMGLLVRGILWLPGYELWGAGALWTALPRTAFLSLIPLAFIPFLPGANYKNGRFWGALLCGLISNFHPISGFSVCGALLISDMLYQKYVHRANWVSVLKQSMLIFILMVTGLSPFIYTYLTEVITKHPSDINLYHNMLELRIGDLFRDPFLVLARFRQAKWMLFISLSIIPILFLYKKLNEKNKRIILFFMCFLLVILLLSFLVVPVEKLLRNTGVNLNMSFQLIRNIKYIMIPVYIFFFIILLHVISLFRKPAKKIISISLLGIFIIVLFISRVEPFRNLPLTGDDLIRATLPNVFSIKPETYTEDKELDAMFEWINDNTPVNAKFVGPTQMRTACRRSVVFDFKGASMLIEGNPDKFILWGERLLKLRESTGPDCEVALYRQWGANYFLTDKNKNQYSITPLKSYGDWAIYEL